MAITISGENNNDRILAQDGVIDQISGINIVGLITASHIDVGSNINLGNAGIVTATTFVGNLTGNVNSTSPLLLQTGGGERFRITGNNELGIAGANYGSAGQVLTSGGSGSSVTWSAIPTQVTIDDNADNRVITGGSGTNLNAESKLTFDGTGLLHLNNSTGSSDAVLKLESESGSDAKLTLDTSNGGGAGAHIEFRIDGTLNGGIQYVSNASASDTHDLIFKNNSNDERLRITSVGYVQTKSELWVGGSAPVLRWRDSTHGEKATARIGGSDLYFEVANNERLRIVSTGQVQLNGATGKGTSGTSATDLLLANGAAIRFRRANDSNWINTIGIDSSDNLKLGWGGSVDEIHFGIAGIGEQMTLDSSGNLLIGRTSWVDNHFDNGIYLAGSTQAGMKFMRTASGSAGTYDIGIDTDRSFKFVYAGDSGGTGAERLRIKSDGTIIFANKLTNSSSFTSHNTNFYGGDVNTGGVRIEVAHSTTSVSGNTASAAFPHHLLLSNYSGSGSADNRMVSIGFDIPTTSTHANAVIAYQATAAGTGDLQFHLESGNSISEKLRITSAGNLYQSSTGGLSYFTGSSEYTFGSNQSSPPAGGSEAKFQVHDHKTRATMSLNAYMNNAGAPVLQFLSSRSGTPGTLGTKSAINDYLGDIRFVGDNGTNYNSIVNAAQILARQKSTISDGDTTCAGELQFYTGNNTGGSVTEKFRIEGDGRIRYGLDTMGLPGSIQGGGFLMYANNGSNNITRITFTGLVSGCYIATIGYYNAAGQGYGGAMFFVSGYQTATYTYDIHEVRRWDTAGNSSISNVTKSGSNWYIEITNTHGSYNGGGEVNLYGDAQATFAVTYRQ